MKILQLVASCVIALIATLTAASLGSPLAFLTHGDPLFVSSMICLAFILGCFVMAWVTGDYSQTDRLWSVAPAVYAIYFTLRGWPDARLVIMSVLALLWGARLSLNFARKGGYTTEEDYRWGILKQRITNPVLWQLFNFFFIAGYQHLQVFLFTLPAWVALRFGGGPINTLDIIAVLLFLGLLAMETTADEQMWRFQQEKKRRISSGESLTGDFGRGFLSSGLYRFSRHPNYFAEVFMWWCFYLFVPASTGSWLHWTIFGAISLTILFQGSIWFVESISAAKYPEYAVYQRRVSWFIPWFARSMDGRVVEQKAGADRG